MKLVLFALGAAMCFGQSSIQIRTETPLASGPSTANAGTGQPFPAKLVIAKPFSADATLMSDQMLPDGSHVINQQTDAIARDTHGRTYREEVFGPPDSSNPAPKIIYIADPISQTTYVLGPDHVARKIPISLAGSQLSATSVSTGAPPQGDLALQRFRTAVAGGGGVVRVDASSAQPAPQTIPTDSRVDQLGTQIIAGIEAEGTRTTLTIPPGQVGNEKALVIVTETWYSTDLEATVLARRTDPRFGTSSYQLTNIQQTVPPASLFQIPSSYTIEETGR